MAGGGGGGPQKSEVTQTNIPEYARPYVETMLGAGQQQIFNYETDPETGEMTPTGIKPYQPFSQDPNAYFAGFSPMQEQSFYGAANLGVAPQLAGATGMAAEAGMRGLDTRYQTGQFDAPQFGDRSAQQYMNPYMQDVVNVQQREAQRQADIAGTQRGAQAVQSGAFGGSRQAILDAEAARNLATQKGDIQAQGSNLAYQQAQQQFNADMARRQQAQQMYEQSRQYGAGIGLQGLQTGLQAAGTLGQLGQTQYGQNVGNIQLQNQFGGQQQAQQQALMNAEGQNFAAQQRYPYQQLEFMSNILRGTPMGTVQSLYTPPPSTAQTVASLGLGAAGVSKMFAEGGLAEGMAAGDMAYSNGGGLGALALNNLV